MHLFMTLVLSSVIVGVFSNCSIDSCRSTETCCPAENPGLWNCCPESDAVCCPDMIHCCPKDSVCDMVSGGCFPRMKLLVPYAFKKRSGDIEAEEENGAIHCGEGSFCPHQSTCCIDSDGQYSCCPFPKGVCCQDRSHCCQEGEQCDSTSRFCLRNNDRNPALSNYRSLTGEELFPKDPNIDLLPEVIDFKQQFASRANDNLSEE